MELEALPPCKKNFYLHAAKHMHEVEEDGARYPATNPHPQRKARLRKKLGGRRARRVGLRGSGGGEGGRGGGGGINGRTLFKRTMRSVSEQLTEKARNNNSRTQGMGSTSSPARATAIGKWSAKSATGDSRMQRW
eukprot:5938073-Amphidinium_carterae.1